MSDFTETERRKRAFQRVAYVLKGMWEEQSGPHTRLFDTLIPSKFCYLGKSANGGGHREHVVPCVAICRIIYGMYDAGESIESAAAVIERLLRVADITKSEADYIDHKLGLKRKMPEGWNYRTVSIMARLDLAGVKLGKNPQ